MLHNDEKQSGSIHNTNVPASQVILRVVLVQIVPTAPTTIGLSAHRLLSKLVLIFQSCRCCRWMNMITKNYKKSKKVPNKIAGIGTESKWHVVSGA
jgi:hypothetical protein